MMKTINDIVLLCFFILGSDLVSAFTSLAPVTIQDQQQSYRYHNQYHYRQKDINKKYNPYHNSGRLCIKRQQTLLISRESGSTWFSSQKNNGVGRWQQLLSGTDFPLRPLWALDWMPTWLITLRPTVQALICLVVYLFHTLVLTQASIPFPFQLIPNEKGHFQSIGGDSIAGVLVLVVYNIIRRQQISKGVPKKSTLPGLLCTPTIGRSPWKRIYLSKYSRVTSLFGFGALIYAYCKTGIFGVFWEDAFYFLGNFFPLTQAMHRALSVLFGHLSWVAMGTIILRLIPRPQNFFENWYQNNVAEATASYLKKKDSNSTEYDYELVTEATFTPQWVWWTIGGYFVSSMFFNVADFLNQVILPTYVLESVSELVVSQLINPEFNDIPASILGYIAPCICAPWWEEVLYRGYMLPTLVLLMGYKWAVLVSGTIFSLHHMSPTGSIPLAILGLTWSILYTKSENLFVTILVHAMWNSRVFLASWLGL